MEHDKNTLLKTLIERFERQSASSSGALTEAMQETLCQVFQLVDPGGHTGDDAEVRENLASLGPTNYQADMDREILSMLTAKSAELDSLANNRELTSEELAVQTSILDFINEIEGTRPAP
jgi:hypothetical protein